MEQRKGYMDNQQRKTVGLDFIAGILTGEGSFFIEVWKHRGDKLKLTPVVCVRMKDTHTMELVADGLRQHGLPVWVTNKPIGMTSFRVQGLKRAKKYIDTFLPYLTGTKYEAARLLGEFVDMRLASPVGSGYTEEQIEVVKKLREVNGVPNRRRNPL